MNTRLYNARILSMVNGCDITEGEVWITDDTISFVGKPLKEADIKFDIEDILNAGMENLTTHELNGHRFPTFSEEINGLILLDHIRHHLYGGLGIRQIIDWAMFLKDKADNKDAQEKLLYILRNANLEKFCGVLTKMCVFYLGLPDSFPWCRDADGDTARQLLDTVFEKGNFGRKDPYVYKPMESLTQGVREKGLFCTLQTAGLANWEACQKHKFLRPFAWIYQTFRYIARGLSALFHGENLKEDIKKGNEDADFHEKLGI